jgi:hypothetical protein
MKAVLGVLLFTFFGYCEIAVWGFMVLFIKTAFISAENLLSPEAMFDLYTRAPEMYIFERLALALCLSLVSGVFLTFLYWLIRRYYMLPETVIETLGTRSFFKWQTTALLGCGIGATIWHIYKIFHPYPEAWL